MKADAKVARPPAASTAKGDIRAFFNQRAPATPSQVQVAQSRTTPTKTSLSQEEEKTRGDSAVSTHSMSRRESTVKKTLASREKRLAREEKAEQRGTARRKLALIEEEIRPSRVQEEEDEPVAFDPTWDDLKCLRSTGRDSWLSDVVIFAYLKRISLGTAVCVIDPLVSSVNYQWPEERRGLPRSTRELEGV